MNKELIWESFNTLALNKVRTGLAMLGVIIGIGSVIGLMGLGQASQRSVENRIKSLGSNLLTIMPGAIKDKGIRGAAGGKKTLTYNDAQAIKNSSKIKTVKNVTAEYGERTQVIAGKNNTNTQVSGVTPEYLTVRNLDLASGSFINEQHLNLMSKVAVLAPQTAIDLFGEGANPIGRTIRIKGISFKVIGLTETKGGSGFSNQDDRIYVSLTTAQKLIFGVDYLSAIYIEAVSDKLMNEARDDVGYFLLARHKIKDATQADFSIMSQEDILGTANQVTGTFTALLSGIAAISLLVGGIGIMNIMLVTVTERTREIGLRKALGAKRKTITTQFLLEATMITIIGGVLGVVLGIIVSFLLSRFMNLPFVFSLPSVFLAFGVSAIIGILFGWYPAQKAAKLQPIEALRYE